MRIAWSPHVFTFKTSLTQKYVVYQVHQAPGSCIGRVLLVVRRFDDTIDGPHIYRREVRSV